jgi:hypothetical protein
MATVRTSQNPVFGLLFLHGPQVSLVFLSEAINSTAEAKPQCQPPYAHYISTLSLTKDAMMSKGMPDMQSMWSFTPSSLPFLH